MIRRLTVRNFLCYRHQHELVLGPTIYGVTARSEQDPERSNWNGKTSLLESIRYALDGWHRHRTDDEAITDGEEEMSVKLAFDDLTVERSKRRGQSAKLIVWHQQVESRGDDAREVLDRWMGIRPADYEWTWFFSQRRIARMVLAEPRDRMDMAASWFGFGKLQEAAKLVRAGLDTTLTLVEHKEIQLGALTAKHAGFDPGDGTNKLEVVQEMAKVRLERAQERLEKAKAAAGRANQKVEERRSREAGTAALERYKKLVEEGRQAREVVDAEDEAALNEAARQARVALDDAIAGHRRAATACADASRVAKGEFDGCCPVSGRACPVRDEINADQAVNEKRLLEARQKLGDAEVARTKADGALTQVNGRAREHDRAKLRLDLLRNEARAVRAQAEQANDGGPLPEVDPDELASVGVELMEATREHEAARTAHEFAQKDAASYQELAEAIVRLRRSAAVQRAALAILGPNGAQRRIAEKALGRIGADANRGLRNAGIDLSLEVTWGRETKALASTCSACGHAHSKSRREKVCTRCGEERGHSFEERLDIALSDRSGAAEDIAGLAFQLAAAAWLKRRRNSSWDVVAIDEPFGQLDAANRIAVARHLATMLGDYGFRQAFVVAHHSSVTEMLPGQLEVVKGMSGSVPAVLA